MVYRERWAGTTPPMDRRSIGQAGLQGWRSKVADSVAGPVARRSSKVSENDVRGAIGALFLALTLAYLYQAARELLADRN